MANFDFTTTRSYLVDFRFKPMFIEVLGWSSPKNVRQEKLEIEGIQIQASPIAQLAGIVVFEITNSNADLPSAKTRVTIHKEISKLYHENLLIFLDKGRTQSLWYWVKREGKRAIPREHLYVKGQPGDLFLGKLSAIFVDISELDEKGDINVIEVAQRLQKALDVERVTKKFFTEFAELRFQFLDLIQGIEDDHDRRWYASVLLNRLMFIYFLQKKKFVDNGDLDYLQRHLEASEKQGKDRYYAVFLRLLFFEGFAKPKEKRSAEAQQILGEIRYLSGSIFLPHPVEIRWKSIAVPDVAFENLFKLFSKYSWNLDDTPGGKDDEINPDVLGYIFEKYINQKAFGAYYTRPEITEYLCESTIYHLVLDAVNTSGVPGVLLARHFESIPELLVNLDTLLCRQLLFEVLPKMSLLDPACGSGAFLVAAMKTLINIYSAVTGKIEYLGDAALTEWLQKTRKEHPSLSYYIKRRIITDNLYGVDIMEEASEITRVRLFLALVASAQKMEDLEPLPNIDFNILSGNSLIGLLRVDEKEFDRQHYRQGNLFQKSYRQLVNEKQRQLEIYRNTTQYTEDLQFLRDEIDNSRRDAYNSLNDLLLNEFSRLGIKIEQAIWDEKKNTEGKALKRAVQVQDVETLLPFHWGYEFDEVMNVRGGFDAIITNPPWEVFQTNEKEFFMDYAPNIQKKKLQIEDWEVQKAELMVDPAIKEDWLKYASRFPHQWAYFKKAAPFTNQTTIIDGKAVGNKPNLYSLFCEQCYNLLRKGGLCGIVLPSGIYTDLGTKQLRNMLFEETTVTGLFGIENRKFVFEGIDVRFKFVVLTFEKGGITSEFPAAFMRHDVKELETFPLEHSLKIPVRLIRQLSPDSLSVIEFKDNMEIQISEKVVSIPLLSNKEVGWGIELYGEELNMTRSAEFFHLSPTNCTVYEGSMIWHYDHKFAEPRYWVNEQELKQLFLEKKVKRIPNIGSIPKDMKNDYETYRLAIRKIASNTNERTLISTILPPYSFAGNSLTVNFPYVHTKSEYTKLQHSTKELFVVTAILNSFVADYILRSRMTTNLNLFFLYQLPIPFIKENQPFFQPILDRSARLICTSPEYDELAKSVGLSSYKDGIAVPEERARLKAELDGLVAHLYGLSEEEFSHILGTFPIVDETVKQAALEAFRKLTPDGEIAAFLASGEGEKLEFKQAAFMNPFMHKPDEAMRKNIAEAVSAFMNSHGGTLLIGVTDDGKVKGVEHEFSVANPSKKNWDGYQLALADILQSRLSIANPFHYYRISQHLVYGKIICRIDVEPAPEPVYIEKKLLIREGNRTRELQGPDLIGYFNSHWKIGKV